MSLCLDDATLGPPRNRCALTWPTKPGRTAMTDAPSDVLNTLAAITAESLTRCTLDPNSLLAARVAALAAVDAPAASYLMHIGPATDAGVTADQIQNILIGIAPVIGTPRTLA